MLIHKEDILKYIRTHQKLLQQKYSVKSIGLFGSYARGDESSKSDIDLLVEFEPGVDSIYEKKQAIRQLLRDKFDVRIDLLNKKYIRPYAKEYIFRDMIYAFQS